VVCRHLQIFRQLDLRTTAHLRSLSLTNVGGDSAEFFTQATSDKQVGPGNVCGPFRYCADVCTNLSSRVHSALVRIKAFVLRRLVSLSACRCLHNSTKHCAALRIRAIQSAAVSSFTDARQLRQSFDAQLLQTSANLRYIACAMGLQAGHGVRSGEKFQNLKFADICTNHRSGSPSFSPAIGEFVVSVRPYIRTIAEKSDYGVLPLSLIVRAGERTIKDRLPERSFIYRDDFKETSRGEILPSYYFII
jgi:hypothetical protein